MGETESGFPRLQPMEIALPELVLDRTDDFRDAVLRGFALDKKVIPARFFYDRRGSELFEAITRLPEYYPTRTEIGLLKTHASDIANLAGLGRPLIEFGSGSSTKTPIVIAALRPSAYVPVDISAEFLESAAASLGAAHPGLAVLPVAADFTQPFDLPDLPRPLTGFFPGSTIGNLAPGAAVDLLRSFRETLGEDARLVIGLDTRKNKRLLEAAYDDADGVTAEFNLNLLHRINRELNSDIPVDVFEHRAHWHDGKGRIEMHLLATRDIAFAIDGEGFTMREGETIHTENSYKYSADEARIMARAAGWEPMAMWMDADALFSVHVWAADAGELEP